MYGNQNQYMMGAAGVVGGPPTLTQPNMSMATGGVPMASQSYTNTQVPTGASSQQSFPGSVLQQHVSVVCHSCNIACGHSQPEVS